MKRISIILICLYSLSISATLPKSEKGVPKGIVFFAELGGWNSCDSTNFIFIKTTFQNNSEDTLTYFRMTCSWTDSYTTDNKDFTVEKNICYSNVHQIIKIPPHKSEEEYIRITTKLNIQAWRKHEFRVGYNFVLPDHTKDLYYNITRLSDMKSIIWSDTLHLKSFWKDYIWAD